MAASPEVHVVQRSKGFDSPDLHHHNAEKFIKYCAKELKWKDLSKDVIMDLGCGKEMHCCSVILKEFSDVGAFIAVDNDQTILQKLRKHYPMDRKVHLEFADIMIRETLRNYTGKMTKVVSTNTFHLLPNKKLGFETAYDLLKPSGEAAFLFYLDCGFDHFLSRLREKTRFRAMYNDKNVFYFCSDKLGHLYYKKMLEEIGFQNVRSKEVQCVNCYVSDEECKNHLYKVCSNCFNIPPGNEDKFKEEIFQLYTERMDRQEGKLYYTALLLYLLAVKPI